MQKTQNRKTFSWFLRKLMVVYLMLRLNFQQKRRNHADCFLSANIPLIEEIGLKKKKKADQVIFAFIKKQ